MADPLYKFPIFRTSDSEQLIDSALTVFGATRVELSTPRNFEARANFLQLRDIALAFGVSSSGIVLDYPETDFVRFQIGLKGRAITIATGERTEINEQQACITSSSRAARMICDGNHERLTLRLSNTALERRLISLLGSRPKGKLEFGSAANINHPQTQSLWQLIWFFAGQFSSSSCELPSRVLGELEQAITTTFLCANRHTFSHLLEQAVKDSAPWQVRRVEDYIEANWNKAIDIETLVNVTGVSARSIFQTFKRSRGHTPKAFAKMVRLRHAKDMLTSPDLHTSVTGVAFACGFANLGHFAKEFQEAFGELPSAVLARSKGQVRPYIGDSEDWYQ